MKDTGWVGDERKIGPWRLATSHDEHWPHRPWRARVWVALSDREVLATPTRHADTEVEARHAAEAALRDLCRQTLAALEKP